MTLKCARTYINHFVTSNAFIIKLNIITIGLQGTLVKESLESYEQSIKCSTKVLHVMSHAEYYTVVIDWQHNTTLAHTRFNAVVILRVYPKLAPSRSIRWK